MLPCMRSPKSSIKRQSYFHPDNFPMDVDLTIIISHNYYFSGPGEAGKSTLIKQMQLIHGDNMEIQEKLKKIPYIRQNIFDSMVVRSRLYLLYTYLLNVGGVVKVMTQWQISACIY